ncbi:MAG TPA: ABC transporter substrate-binding protein [Clostridiales bacterium]|nr:ABC transporter substrate-binding protein [Clostridiales bacterium]
MKLLKKVAVLGLAGVLAASTMIGCSKSSTENGGNKETNVTNGTSSGDTSSKETDPGETIPIRWYLAGSGPQADVEAVQKEIDKYLLDTYNMNIDLQIIASDYASYTQKMQMVISSGEEYDICWTASWNNNYYDNVNKNAFMELDELLVSDAPELLESMDTSIWEGTRVNGKIYGVPSQQIFPKQNYIVIDKAYVDKYKLDTNKVKKLSDLEDFFLQVKADNPDIYPFAASSNGLMGKLNLAIGYEPIAGVKLPGVIATDGTDYKVLNQYTDLPSLKEFYDLMYKWQKEGLVRQDAATVSDNAVPDIKAGKHIAAVNATFKPGIEATEQSNFGGREVVFIMLSDSYMATDSLVSSLNAISRTSKHPEVAMKFLNLVNTDKTLYNLLCFGVEGVHYTLNDEGKVISDNNKGYNPNIDWMLGNQFNGLLREGQADDVWEETKEINASATKSRVLGFAFDSTKVTNEIAAVNAAIDQYALPLETGAVDPDTVLSEFTDKLKAAGSDKIIAEMQTQLDAWVAANK